MKLNKAELEALPRCKKKPPEEKEKLIGWHTGIACVPELIELKKGTVLRLSLFYKKKLCAEWFCGGESYLFRDFNGEWKRRRLENICSKKDIDPNLYYESYIWTDKAGYTLLDNYADRKVPWNQQHVVSTYYGKNIAQFLQTHKKTDAGWVIKPARRKRNEVLLDPEKIAEYAKPPANWYEQMEEDGRLCGDVLAYCTGSYRDPLSGYRKALKVRCSCCQNEFYTNREFRDSIGAYQRIQLYHWVNCPICETRVECMTENKGLTNGFFNERYCHTITAEKCGREVYFFGWGLKEVLNLDLVRCPEVELRNIYVFTDTVRARFEKINGDWERKKGMFDTWTWFGGEIEPKPQDEHFFDGTALENAHIYEFERWEETRTSTGRVYKPGVITYLRKLKQTPLIENLLLAGYPRIAMELSSNKKCIWLDAKKASPAAALGLTKPEFRKFRNADMGIHDISTYSLLKGIGWEASPEQCKMLAEVKLIDMVAAEGKNIKRLVDVLDDGQHDPTLISTQYVLWKDYLRLGQAVDVHIENPKERYHPNWRELHDQYSAAATVIQNNNDALAFAKVWKNVRWADYSDGTYLIKAAKCTEELILEGTVLDHCVKGYTRNCIAGRMVWFVRKCSDPTLPYYTLNVDIHTLEEIQLHGYQNDRQNPIPDDVRDFCTFWRTEIFAKGEAHFKKMKKKQAKKRKVAKAA